MMSQLNPTEAEEFAAQMRALVEEAEQQQLLEVEPGMRREPLGLLEMLRPLVIGIEALSRATAENRALLTKMSETMSMHMATPLLMTGIQENLERKNSLNQQLFDALYEELKGFKDGFLLDVLHKPLIRDLITLYDDLSEIHRQVAAANLKPPSANRAAAGEPVCNVGANLGNVLEALLEILARLDVQKLDAITGKLDKQTQRAVTVELAINPLEDGDVVRSLKPGFNWRAKLFRPEDVVVKKWKEGYLVALSPDA